ncbi:50S ribosomal protein L6 [Candidatus Woesearchaeota archaeon]|nr:50S ribosomal protein L6 [Candidatus Woesearchaeota archaeon]
MKSDIIEKIGIPEDVNVDIDNRVVRASCGNNKIERVLFYPKISIVKEGDYIIIKSAMGTKREKRLIGSFSAHIKNMLKGIKSNYVYKVIACSSHFPMSIIIDKNEIVIKNFLGEKIPRKTKLIEGVSVNIEGNMIIIKGIDKEKVGQMAGKIELLTKVRGRDKRVFQDGCYITDKNGKLVK